MMKYNIIKLVTLAFLSLNGIKKRQLTYRKLQFFKTIQKKNAIFALKKHKPLTNIVWKLFINSG